MGWDKITIEQYEYLEPITKKIKAETDPMLRADLWVSVLTYLYDKPKDHYESMDGNRLRLIIHNHNFILHPEQCNEVRPTITVDNQFYKGLTDITTGAFAQYYMLKTYLANEAPLSSLLGCIYCPMNLFSSKYDMAEVAKSMKKARCSQVLGLVFFYSRVYERLMPAIQGYLEMAQDSILAHQESNLQKPTDGM